MCGLFGYKTAEEHNPKLNKNRAEKRKRILEALAIAMEKRGKDSTGLAIMKGSDAKLVKDVEEAEEFMDDKKTQKVLSSYPSFVIGHTRWKTVGEINIENAHPFKKGAIVGAHNGSVSNYLTIDKKVNVDSEAIFQLLKETKNDYKSSFKRLSGTFAITWANLKEPDVFYCVKDGNPLSMAYVPSMKTIFWCSEADPLNQILRATLGKGRYKWYDLKDETVYRFDNRLKRKQYRVEFMIDSKWEDDEKWNYSSAYGGYKTYSPSKLEKDKKFEDDMAREIREYNRSFGKQGNIEFEDDEDEYEDGYLMDYDKDGKLVMSKDTLYDLRRRVFEEGCCLCNEGIGGDTLYYDTENDQLYCESCAKELAAYPEYQFIEKIHLF